MVASASGVVALKTLFIVSICIMLALSFWVIGTDGLTSCVDLCQKWLMVTLINLYTNLGVIVAWVIYKESSWIKAVVLIPIVVFAGSDITSAYIVIQLFKLSPEELSKDPLYFVLVRHKKEDPMEKRRGHSVLTTKVIISALGCLILGTLIYVIIVDGSPLRTGIFSKCMIATTADVYFSIITLSAWIAYKESSWTNAFFWMVSLLCFGSIATCVYIVRQLIYLTPQQSISALLVNNNDKDLLSSNPLLMAHTNV